VKFAPSADKHGISHDDIEYVVAHCVYDSWLPDSPPFRTLYLGPNRAGNFLEVVLLESDDGTEVAIHAMRMQAKYEPLIEEVLTRE
jgi:hypothetical protein